MADVWGTLGETSLQAGQSPETLRAVEKVGYEEISRIGEKPLLQNTGDSLTELRVTFTLSLVWCVPETELRKLQVSQRLKEPLYLSFGDGRFNGHYVLTSLRSDVIDTTVGGNITNVGVQVTLKEVADYQINAIATGSPFVSAR